MRKRAKSDQHAPSFMFAAFMLTTVTNAITPFLVLPIAIAVAGVDAWSSIATGTALGGLAATIVALGWPVTGPVAIAKSSSDCRRALYLDSLRSRGSTLLIVLPLCIAGSYVLTPIGLYGAAAASGAALFGLSPIWYFTGTGDPVSLLTACTLARLVPLAIGVLVSYYARAIFPYLLGALAGNVAVMAISTRVILSRARSDRRHPFTPVTQIVRDQLPALVTALGASAYVSLPVPIVSFVAPRAAGAFAATLSIANFATTLLRPGTQTLQAWVPRNGDHRLQERVRVAIKIGALASVPLGAAAGISAFLVIGPLSDGKFTLGAPTAAVMGAAIACVASSQVCGLVCLSALDSIVSVMRSTILGAAVALPLIAIAVRVLGVFGAWGTLFIAELIVLAYQLGSLKRRLATGVKQLGKEVSY